MDALTYRRKRKINESINDSNETSNEEGTKNFKKDILK